MDRSQKKTGPGCDNGRGSRPDLKAFPGHIALNCVGWPGDSQSFTESTLKHT